VNHKYGNQATNFSSLLAVYLVGRFTPLSGTDSGDRTTSGTGSPTQATIYPPENKAFFGDFEGAQAECFGVFFQTREFSPQLVGRPIFPTRFNALI
jgi:hypothetical protein